MELKSKKQKLLRGRVLIIYLFMYLFFGRADRQYLLCLKTYFCFFISVSLILCTLLAAQGQCSVYPWLIPSICKKLRIELVSWNDVTPTCRLPIGGAGRCHARRKTSKMYILYILYIILYM